RAGHGPRELVPLRRQSVEEGFLNARGWILADRGRRRADRAGVRRPRVLRCDDDPGPGCGPERGPAHRGGAGPEPDPRSGHGSGLRQAQVQVRGGRDEHPGLSRLPAHDVDHAREGPGAQRPAGRLPARGRHGGRAGAEVAPPSHHHHRRAMNRRGFTIIELMVAIAIFAIVLGAGLQLLGAQSRGMARGADRVGATQNLQYAASILTRHLRTIGTSVPAGQPFLVYADSEVVAFNADYATNLVGDPSAVYYDPDAPPGSVMALTPANQITIPRSSFTYPRTTYTLPDGSNSPAELIIFYFQPDVTTPRPDDYVLMRQVNDRPPEVVARILVRSPDGRPFFQYFRLVSTSSGSRVDSVLPNALPLA